MYYYIRAKCKAYAPVNCNHGPPWSGGVPVIAGEVGRVLTFQVALQCRGNAVVSIHMCMCPKQYENLQTRT